MLNGILKNNKFEKKDYQEIIEEKANKIITNQALRKLTNHLEETYNKKVIVLIDEYNLPMQISLEKGYYSALSQLIDEILSPLLKDNFSLYQAILTDILKMEDAGPLSGLNNFKSYSFLSNKYLNHFGFSSEEVTSLLGIANDKKILGMLNIWCGGYQVKENRLFNPASIIKFIEKNREFLTLKENSRYQFFSPQTPEEQFIKKFLKDTDENTRVSIKSLFDNKSIVEKPNDKITFFKIRAKEASVFSYLFLAGYLTENKNSDELLIPNQETLEFLINITRIWCLDKQVIAQGNAAQKKFA